MYKPWWIILEVENDASIEEIKEAYARLIKQHHSEDDTEAFMEIKDAYRQAMRIKRLQNKNRVIPTVDDDFKDYKKQEKEKIINHKEINKTLEIEIDKDININEEDRDFLDIFGDKGSKRYKIAELSNLINYFFRTFLEDFKKDEYHEEYKWILLFEYLKEYSEVLTKDNLDYCYRRLKDIDYTTLNYDMRMSVFVPALEDALEKTSKEKVDVLILESILTQAKSPKQAFKAKRYLLDTKFRSDYKRMFKKNPIVLSIIECLILGLVIYALINLFVG